MPGGRPRKTLKEYEAEAVRVGKCLIHPSGVARKVYTLRHGKLPTHLYVCHTCDTPACIRDSHHFIGTHDVNMLDSALKGRAKHSLETRQKQRLAAIAAAKRPEVVARRSAAQLIAQNRPITKLRKRLGNLGVGRSDETRASMRMSHLGLKESDETRAKKSEAAVRSWKYRKPSRKNKVTGQFESSNTRIGEVSK